MRVISPSSSAPSNQEKLQELEEKYGVDKKLVRKVSRTLFKASFFKDKQDNDAFEEAYETLING